MAKNKYCVSARFNEGTMLCDDVFAESEEKAIEKFLDRKEIDAFIVAHKNDKGLDEIGGLQILSTKAVLTK